MSSFFVLCVSFQKFDVAQVPPSHPYANFPCTPVYSYNNRHNNKWRDCSVCISVLKYVSLESGDLPPVLYVFAELLVFVLGSAISMANPLLQHYPAHWWAQPGWKSWHVCLCINLSHVFTLSMVTLYSLLSFLFFPSNPFLSSKAPLLRIFYIKWLWIMLKVLYPPRIIIKISSKAPCGSIEHFNYFKLIVFLGVVFWFTDSIYGRNRQLFHHKRSDKHSTLPAKHQVTKLTSSSLATKELHIFPRSWWMLMLLCVCWMCQVSIVCLHVSQPQQHFHAIIC